MRALSSFFVLVSSVTLAACGGQIQGEDTPGGSRDPSPSPSGVPNVPPGFSPAPSAPVAPPAPSPLSCPAAGTGIAGASFVSSSIALDAATYHLELPQDRGGLPQLVEGVWSGSTHAVSTTLPGARGMAELEKLSSDLWGVTEGFSDAASRNVVVYRRMIRLGSFLVPNGSLDRTFLTEGISPDGSKVVYQSGRSVAVATVAGGDGWQRNARTICVDDCELLWAKGDEVLMVRRASGAPEMLIRRYYAAIDTPSLDVVDPTAGRKVVAVTTNRIFLGASERNAPLVLDRATLTPVPFTWEPSDAIRAAQERTDGSFDIYSIYSGEIASAKHVSSTGRLLGEGEGRAMYGQVSVGACGFWSDGTLVPFAKDTR